MKVKTLYFALAVFSAVTVLILTVLLVHGMRTQKSKEQIQAGPSPAIQTLPTGEGVDAGEVQQGSGSTPPAREGTPPANR